MKKVSLILTTYNCADNLKKTLAAIDTQDYPNIEICIADSCSTDGTIDVIKEYVKAQESLAVQEETEMLSKSHEHSIEKSISQEQAGEELVSQEQAGEESVSQEQCQKEVKSQGITHKQVVWKSEKDSGIYDGLNHSIALASGDYMLVMNDEFTMPDAISLLVKALEECEKDNPDKNVVGVHSDLVYATDGKVIRSWKMGQGKLSSGWMPAHPTLLLKASVYQEYGLYDTSYVSAADYEYMVRFLKDKKNVLAYVPQTLVSMFYGGTSSGGLYNYWRSIMESLRALKQNHVPFGLWITFLRTIRVALQFIH